jgi:hypothetical protein
MEAAGTIFLIWFLHMVISVILAGPILWFGRKRIGWAGWQFLALVIPFCLWSALMLSPLSADKKSLANLGEPVYISFTMPVLALLRIAVGRRLSEIVYAFVFISVLCVVAVATFFLVPFKPE